MEPLRLHSLFGPNRPKQVSLGNSLLREKVNSFLSLVHEFFDIFAWLHADMPDISPTMTQYYLNLQKECKPICQKLRRFHPTHQEVIKREVDKLLAANFVREIQYPEWLSNDVVIPKKNGKWRLCIDYSNLNDACPKNTFPPPRIDQIMDATTSHQLLSFLDAYSGYNQIPMIQ